MMKRIYMLASLIGFVALTSQGQVKERLEGFTQIEVFGKLNVRLEHNPNDSIFIESGSFDISKVKYEIKDSVLSVKLLSEFPPSIKVNVTIQFTQLNSIICGGGTKIYNRGSINSKLLNLKAKSGSEFDLLVNVDSVLVKVSKGAFVRLTGENKYLKVKTNTGGDFRSLNMSNVRTDAILNGGSVEIKTAEYLKAKVWYGATLKYVEKPNKIVKKERFGGKIDKLEDF